MALKLERENRQTTGAELAATYLNMCAIHSELNQHKEAIDKAAKSVLLIKQYIKTTQPKDDLDKVISEVGTESRPERAGEDQVTLMGTYCAAYFNLGVSFEHLKHYKLSTQAYERGLAIAKEHMPKNVNLIDGMECALDVL